MTPFEALAAPKRRVILDLLAHGALPVNELVVRLGLSQPLVSKHLRVLREAGMVTSTVQGTRRVYSIEPGPLAEVDAWIAKYRPFWASKLDALEQALDERKGARP